MAKPRSGVLGAALAVCSLFPLMLTLGPLYRVRMLSGLDRRPRWVVAWVLWLMLFVDWLVGAMRLRSSRLFRPLSLGR